MKVYIATGLENHQQHDITEAAADAAASAEYWACSSRDGTCPHTNHHPIRVGPQREGESDERYAVRKMLEGTTPHDWAMMGVI